MWDSIEEQACRWLHRLSALVLLPLLVAVVAADVVARYALSMSLQWAQDVSTLAMLTLFVAALPIVTRRGGHIRVEIVHDRFSPRARALADVFADLCGIAFAGLLAFQELAEVPHIFERGEGAETINLPYWPIAAFVGLCAGLVSLMLLVSAACRIHRFLRGASR